MQIEKYRIPFTRDPFVNTPLIKAGFDTESGEERFWITSWNANTGCLGALVTPSGKCRVYRFKKTKGLIGCGGYSACLTDNDTIWLISDLQAFVELKLSTGEYEVYETGAPSALVFSGMQYDEKTHKLFAGAYVPHKMHAVSFDIEKKKTVKIYKDFTDGSCMKGGFAVGDGTYCMNVLFVQNALYRWDPVAETVTHMLEMPETGFGGIFQFPEDSEGRHYVVKKGWMNPDGTMDDSPASDIVAEWFGCDGDDVYCMDRAGLEHRIYRWNRKSGELKTVCSLADNIKCNFTKDGNIITVSVYGQLKIFTKDGELILDKWLDTDAQGEVDCIIPINDHMVLGTPFITQRFWLLDTKTGEGLDAGRASPGGGEVLQTWNAAGKTYMASYTKGVLTEFDAEKPIDFPENPRIVCEPLHSMRPVAQAQIGDTLYYASNHPYGVVGCEFVKYNAVTGETLIIDDPFPTQQVCSMYTLPGDKVIIGGTSYESDCGVAPALSDESFVIEICPDTMEILKKTKVPAGTMNTHIIGNIDGENLLCMLEDASWEQSFAAYNVNTKEISLLDMPHTRKNKLRGTKKEGKFVRLSDGKVEVVSLDKNGIKECRVVCENDRFYNIYVYGDDIYVVTPTELYIMRGAID